MTPMAADVPNEIRNDPLHQLNPRFKNVGAAVARLVSRSR